MPKFSKPAFLALLLSICAQSATAASYTKQAERAVHANLAAVSVFVDATFGMRKDGAAKELTEAHAAFAAQGYMVVDVVGYTENGDLQGFFVTYRRSSTPAS